MSEVALATAQGVTDDDHALLDAALQTLGIAAAHRAWDDDGVDWTAYDLTVVRSTWGYWRRPAAFVDWARAQRRLENPLEVVEWAIDKHYLGDLAASGVPTIPTDYATCGATAALPAGPVVVKPTVAGGSSGALRFGADDHAAARAHVDALAAMGCVAMVQPLVDGVVEHGELDVVVIDGEVSHAVRKRATLGERIHVPPTGAASWMPDAPDAAALDVVAAALSSIPGGPSCYARVDLVDTPDGPCVLELELVEPYLFLAAHPDAPARLAAAIARRTPG